MFSRQKISAAVDAADIDSSESLAGWDPYIVEMIGGNPRVADPVPAAPSPTPDAATRETRELTLFAWLRAQRI